MKARFIDTGLIDSPADTLVKILKSCILSFDAPALKLADELDYYETKIFLTKKYLPLTKVSTI